MQLSDEQLRALANAGQLYESWKDLMVPLSRLPGGMYWRVIKSREYLYQYATTPAGTQQTKSLGPRKPETEESYEEFKKTKQDLEERRAGIEKRFAEFAPAWRALRLPAIDRTAGSILRAFDLAEFVGKGVLVIGTYALKAYEVEAATVFSAGMDATEDLDFTLLMNERTADPDLPRRLLLTLKQVDSTFVINVGSRKTAVNKNGYRIDLFTNKGQEWLLLGKPVSVVLIDLDGWPAALAAPDPRYFALQKLWLSKKPDRPAIKRAKDKNQGEALLRTVRDHMPQYPLDERFVASLPAPLKEQFPPQ